MVCDSHQGTGIGQALFDEVIRKASAHFNHATADILRHNWKMRRLVAAPGLPVRERRHGSTVSVRIDLPKRSAAAA